MLQRTESRTRPCTWGYVTYDNWITKQRRKARLKYIVYGVEQVGTTRKKGRGKKRNKGREGGRERKRKKKYVGLYYIQKRNISSWKVGTSI